MEIGSAALTALFVGLVWTLIKVVEYFINGTKTSYLTIEQEKLLCDIYKLSTHLDELHSVYDSNHVPKWYVPGELLVLVRGMYNILEALSHEIDDSMKRISSGQESSIEKISELINSQKVMTERLGDLVSMWSKVSKSLKEE